MSEWVKSSASSQTMNCVEVAFHKASASSTNGQCVEIGECSCGGGTIHVRDSKDPGGPVLVFNRGEWDAFLAGVRNGEFNSGV